MRAQRVIGWPYNTSRIETMPAGIRMTMELETGCAIVDDTRSIVEGRNMHINEPNCATCDRGVILLADPQSIT